MTTTLKEDLKEHLYTCIDKFTVHGFPNLYRNFVKKNWFLSIFWLVCFLSGLIYCLITIIQSWNDYFKYGVRVSITKINELPATFPAVTFCNVNPFNSQYALDFIKNHVQGAKCLDLINGGQLNVSEFDRCFSSMNNPESEFLGFIKELINVMASEKLNNSQRMYYGFQLGRDMLVSCSFNGKHCNEDNFLWSWSNIYGNCYTFNMNHPFLGTSTTRDSYGLSIELVVAPAYHQLFYAFRAGIYLTVHNQTALPFTLPPGIGIQTGFRTYVGINREVTNKLEFPYSDCIDNLTSAKNSYSQKLFSFFKDLNVTYYDQNFCFTMCYQDKLIDKCNCQDIKTPIIRNSMYCVNTTQTDCLNNFENFYSETDLNHLCSNACPQKCHTISYNLETSSKYNFPTLSYLHFLETTNSSISHKFPMETNDTYLTQWARDSFLKIIENYNNLYYTSIDESPAVSSSDMFGIIGGQIGLFLGISILTCFEVIELIIELFSILWKFYKHKKLNPSGIISVEKNSNRSKMKPLDAKHSSNTKKNNQLTIVKL